MRKFITLTLAALCLALQPMSAQKKEGNDNFKYHKATEILDKGGNPQEARKLAVENIAENPKHIDSYLLVAGIDRREDDYASALSIIEQAMKNNHKKSGFSEAVLLWWKGIIYEEMGDVRKAAETMEIVVKMAKKEKSEHLSSMMENLAQFRYDLKEYDASDKIYHEIKKLDESSLLPEIGLARNLIAREKYDEALTILNECVKYDRDYAEIYRFRMRAYEGKKEYKKMIDAMITLYEKSDDTDYISIECFKKDKKYAVAVIKEKIASEKNNGLWRAVLATFYKECHMYAEAIPLFGDLLEEYGFDDDPSKRLDIIESRLQAITKLKRKYGTTLDEVLDFADNAAVCVVLASDGYPEKYDKGFEITGFENFKDKDGYYVFHAGTKETDGNIVTNGGRVLGISALGKDIAEAIANAYKGVEQIEFEHMQYRTDIGKKAFLA